ncbi:hypothetical protein H648_42849gpHYP3, partial [Human mastadenovirus C]
RAPTRRGSHQR